MRRIQAHSILLILLLLTGFGCLSPSRAQAPSPRIALVIGNGAYGPGANPTAPNDAGLVAQTLTAAGFDVTGVRDLDGEGTRKAFRDFLDRAGQLGPQGIAFVYLAGYGVQYNGDNYFVPTDATLGRDTDVPIQAVRVADLTQALAGLPIQSRVVVLDVAYAPPFPASKTLPGGLALGIPEAGTLLAFNAAPGTLGPGANGSYGVYSQALAEMMRQGGVPVQEVFDRVRLRVNAQTQGADVPWNASKVTTSFVFLQQGPDAPPPVADRLTYSSLEQRPIREFPAAEAYSVAVARDTFRGYEDFLSAYGSSPYARRVHILLAARREALTWRKTVDIGTGDAYWSYLQRYSHGPHAGEARRRLRSLALAEAPPRGFAEVEYDIPPPPEQESGYVDEPVIIFNVPDEPPPPPPPVYILSPPDIDYDRGPPPPPPPVGPGFLPIPIPIPIPFGRPSGEPGYLRPPPGFSGSYAQPQPFLVTPQGGLRPQLNPTGSNGVPRPASGQPAAPGQPAPIVPGQPAAGALNAGRPVPLPGTPGVPVLLPRPATAQPRPVPGQPLLVPLPGSPLPLRPVPTAPGAQIGGRPAPLAIPSVRANPAPGQIPVLQRSGIGASQPDQQRQMQSLQPQRQPVDQQRQPQMPQQQDQRRQMQLLQQQRQQLNQQREIQTQQQQRQQQNQQQQIQVQQQHQQQDQQRQMQLLQQQRQQLGQQRQIQVQQQQHQQQDQQRQMQLLQQQRQQLEQQRQIQTQQQQRQQQNQQQQIQVQQQHQQLDQQRQMQLLQQQRQQLEQQRQIQLQQQPRPQPTPQVQQHQPVPQQARPGLPLCGRPGVPPCR